MSKPWYESYPLRFEREGDVPLCSNEFDKNKSILSPATDLVLNTLSLPNDRSNYIIAFPSSILRPLPIISYILADKSEGSVLVFSNYTSHYNNYYLMKLDYQFVWNRIPAGEIKKNKIQINPHLPKHAKRSFKNQLEEYIPSLRKKLLDPNYSKILFSHSKNLRLKSSVDNVTVGTNRIISESPISNLGIKTVLFENLDKIVYNNYLYDVFKMWIEELKSHNVQFIFHFANPDYKFLADMKEYFNCYVLFFPYSFLKSNDYLMKKNALYQTRIDNFDRNCQSVLEDFNIERASIYSDKTAYNIEYLESLRKGNIDYFFRRGIKLFSTLDWRMIDKELRNIVYKIQQLFYTVYKVMCIPREFTVRYYDQVYGLKYYSLKRFFPTANKLIEIYSNPPIRGILKNILSYLVSMVNEISECRRFGEPKSYTRIGKNYRICDFLQNYEVNGEIVIIGVQDGEQKALSRLLDRIETEVKYKLRSLESLSIGISDYSNHILVLSGSLLPNHIQILFKNWKKVKFLLYKGYNTRWVKQQVNLISRIDISKEELSLKYLFEITKDLVVEGDYNIDDDPLFKAFLDKKKKILEIEQKDVKDDVEAVDKSIFEKEARLSTTTIKDICRDIMKSDARFKQILNEEKLSNHVYKNDSKAKSKIDQLTQKYDCTCELKNVVSGELTEEILDTQKRYMYFSDIENIKLLFGFPRAINEDEYLVLFGRDEKLSITDFIKEAFEYEEDIDHELIEQWQKDISNFYPENYKSYSKFYKDFLKYCPKPISYGEFMKWVKGEINAPNDPEHLYYLGVVMNNSFIIENYDRICREGKRIQRTNIKIGKIIKKLIVSVLKQERANKDLSIEELGLLEKVENCIFKIINIQIKSKGK